MARKPKARTRGTITQYQQKQTKIFLSYQPSPAQIEQWFKNIDKIVSRKRA